ncbi:MAG: ChuX/HutX family heme-like substrate-binding protein [Pseudomonadota bacterium]
MSATETARAEHHSLPDVPAGSLAETPDGVRALEARVGHDARRLKLDREGAAALLNALRASGPVVTRVANRAALHRTSGPLEEIQIHGAMGQVVGPIDLRLFLAEWRAAYALAPVSGGRSIQVVDPRGRPVIEIAASDATDLSAWDGAIAPWILPDHEAPSFELPPVVADRPDDAIDVAGLRAAWAEIEHSHDFFGLLRRFGVAREQALRLGGPAFARQVDSAMAARVCAGAGREGVRLMCFVGTAGCLQIYSGGIDSVEVDGAALSVLGNGFSLDLALDRVARAWVVVKPTRLRGRITSVELYDSSGMQVCQFFGARRPGERENPAWRAVIEDAMSGGAGMEQAGATG